MPAALPGATRHHSSVQTFMTSNLNRRSAPVGISILVSLAAAAALTCAGPASAQFTPSFRQTLTVTRAEPVTLEVELTTGDLQIFYSRDGQVSITAWAKTLAGFDSKDQPDKSYLKSGLSLEQNNNHITIRHIPSATNQEERFSVIYRIDVPYWTEVTSNVHVGKQTISGIMGPVKTSVEKGDIKASYISKSLQAQVDVGNLDIEVIGEHADVKTRSGNISCSRAAQGVTAETEDGDITLMVVGPSAATIKKGTGRIDIGGARGSLVASTAAGDIHVKALPHDDWRLTSSSGNIRLEFPTAAKLDLDASTDAGEFQVDREDIAKPVAQLRHLNRKINGGGKHIDAHTGSGNVVIR